MYLYDFALAKVTKSIKNIFEKPLVRKKKLCIFALGFRRTANSWNPTDIQ